MKGSNLDDWNAARSGEMLGLLGLIDGPKYWDDGGANMYTGL